MNWFRWRSKSFNISECDPTFKVKYLGNVLTTFVRGDGCVDRPLSTIWNNYLANSSCLDMQLTVTNCGLKVVTRPRNPTTNQQSATADQECVTEYRCHRISYCHHHPQFPKLFVWVYRHEGRKMKVEVRCHAVLCKSEAKAKVICTQLRDKMAFALAEYSREKTRRQNSRLVIQRTRSVPAGVGGIAPLVRTQLLRQGQLFKPSSSNSSNAPHLCAISEEQDEPEGGGSCLATPSRLSWQLEEEEEGDADAGACGVEEGRRRWLRARNGQRNSGDGDDDDDDDEDSVFSSKPRNNFDCRLSDAVHFRSLSENVNTTVDQPSCQSNSSVCLVPSVNSCSTDLSIIRHHSEAVTDSSEVEGVLVSRHPGHHLAPSLSENDVDPYRTVVWERTDPEGMETSKDVPEFDDQSIESGFSEQDAHDP